MVTNRDKLKIGFIGCGRIAQQHLRHLRTMPEVEISALCDIDEIRAYEMRATIGASRAQVFTDPLKMLAEMDFGAVYVMTPTPSHAELGCAVLERGCNLFIEKPLAASRADADRLVTAASASGRITCVGHQWRYLTGVERAKLELGGLPIALVHAWYYWTRPLVAWIAVKETGGGQMVDQGIHLVDLARYVAGEIENTRLDNALVARRDEQFRNSDVQCLLGRFSGGGLLSVVATYALFKEVTEAPTIDFIAKDLLVRVTPTVTELMRPGQTTVIHERVEPMEALDRAFVAACVNDDRSLVRSAIGDARASLDVVMRASEDAIPSWSDG